MFLLFHLKKLYINLLYRFCVTLLFLQIFWLKIICCPPSWIKIYLIFGDFSDVKSRVSHIKLHLNDQITLSLVWKVVRQFFISNSYWSIWFWAHNNGRLGTRTFYRKTLCRKTFCRKTFCRTDILPTDVLPNGRFAERTFCH
jgi:hypothetical protein